jgi:hypothetical protein
MSKAKLILRVNTLGAKRGDEIEADAETAQYLVDNGHALRKKDAPTQPKG